MEQERSEEAAKAEFRAALVGAIEQGDQAFALDLLESRDTDPLKMITWLERQAAKAEPEVVPRWYGVIQGYAQHFLNDRSFGMYRDVSQLEAARDRALAFQGHSS